MAKTVATAQVRLWGKLVGAVAEQDDGTVVFEYDPAFRRSGLEISPIKLPLALAGPVSFPELAREAGIDMPETHLLEERRLGHFLARRFDRAGAMRLHLHSLGGLQHVDYNQPGAFSYEQYLRTVLELNLGYPALEEVFRRMVFNLAAVNQDDHVKNFAFLMDESGKWRLAPAYDVTYASGHGYTRLHQMTLAGKNTGFTRADLLTTGARFGIKQDGAPVLQQVLNALGHWRGYATEAGVPEDRVSTIENLFRRF